MEWLFFATKPSFLSALSWKESLSVLLRAPLVVVLPLLAVVLICWLGNLALSSRAYRRVVVAVARLGPALVLACSGLLLVDNFMVTVFDLGIRSSEGLGMVPTSFCLLSCSPESTGISPRGIAGLKTRSRCLSSPD